MNKIVTKNDLYNLLIENNRQNDAETEMTAFSNFSSNQCLTYDNIINTSVFFTINENLDKNKLVAKKYLSILDNVVIYGHAHDVINVKLGLPSLLSDQNYEILPKSFNFTIGNINFDKNNVIKISSMPKTINKINIFFIFGISLYDDADMVKGEADIYGLSLTYIEHNVENKSIKFKIGEFDDSIPLPDKLVYEYNIGIKGTLPTCTELIGKDIEFTGIDSVSEITDETVEFNANITSCNINGEEYHSICNFINRHDYEDANGNYDYNNTEYNWIAEDYCNVVINKTPKYDYDNIPYIFHKDVIYDVYDASGNNLLESFEYNKTTGENGCLLPLQKTNYNTNEISLVGLKIEYEWIWWEAMDGVDLVESVSLEIINETENTYYFSVSGPSGLTTVHEFTVDKTDISLTPNHRENILNVNLNFDVEERLKISWGLEEEAPHEHGYIIKNPPKLNNDNLGYCIKIRLPEWWNYGENILDRCDVFITPVHGEGTPEGDLDEPPVLYPEVLRYGPYNLENTEYQNFHIYDDILHDEFFDVMNECGSIVIRDYKNSNDFSYTTKILELYAVIITTGFGAPAKSFYFDREIQDDM